LNNTTGDDNTATGFEALLSNIDGTQNTASGWNALMSNTEGVIIPPPEMALAPTTRRVEIALSKATPTPPMARFEILQYRRSVLDWQIRLGPHLHQNRVPLVRSKLRARPRIMALRPIDRSQLRPKAKQLSLLGCGLRSVTRSHNQTCNHNRKRDSMRFILRPRNPIAS
jgi:hypothetical protein